MSSRIRQFWLAAVLALSGTAAAAQTAGELTWHCWYDADGRFRVACFTPEPGAPVNAAFEALVSAGDPLGATRLVRQAPQSYAGSLMYIPIYVHPMRGMDFVARLARAVMCRADPACTVAFDPEVATLPVGAPPR